MVNKIEQKDFYCVYNDYDISSKLKELNLLYLPLIGSNAVKVYQYLGTKILGDKNLSKNYLHYDIFDNLALDNNKFHIARKKLEAIGLLQTYYIENKGVGQYLYKIKEALNFSEFFANPVLAQLLENTIGRNEYLEIKNYYVVDKLSFKNFEDITAKFSDVYRVESNMDFDFEIGKTESVLGPNFDEYYFDFSKLNYYLANSYLTEVIEKEKTKNDILGLAHLYRVSPKDMSKAIEKSVKISNGSNSLDIDALKDYLLQLYVNVRKQDVPVLDSLLNKKILEVENDDTELTEEEKFIREVDNTNYISYLNKQKGLILSNVDAKAIEKMQNKYKFPTGVLNILLEYSINTSNSEGIPHSNYIDKIASSWKSKEFRGAKDAIDFVRKSREKRLTQKNNSSNQFKTTKPRFQNTKVYKAPFPEYLQKSVDNLSVKSQGENRVITKEDEDAYNQMIKELNNKGNI